MLESNLKKLSRKVFDSIFIYVVLKFYIIIVNQ